MTTKDAKQPLVLIVDDDESIRQAERRILEGAGYRVIEASNGSEGLVRLAEAPSLDLLLADLEMPELAGEEMVSRIRPARPELKVLYVTGHIDQLMNERPVLCEGEAFLDKPFSVNGLLEAVSMLLYGQLNTHPPKIDPHKFSG